MKKKMATIVTTFVLCLAMGASALAAPSPSYTYGATTVIDGEEVRLITGGGMTGKEQKASDAFFDKLNDVLDDLYDQWRYEELTDEEYDKKYDEEYQKYMKAAFEEYLGVTCDKVNWYGYMNISLPNGVSMPEGGMDITLKDSRISAGDELIVMHITSAGAYELISVSSVEDGAFTGHFNSLSPVYYFAVDGLKTASQPSAAPKTGEMDLAPVAFAGAALLGVLVFVSRRRKAL